MTLVDGDATEQPKANRVNPHLVAGVIGLAVLLILCVRNPRVFNDPIVEDGDGAANSILVDEAKEFRLLVGHYSRIGFSHPGPAFLYVQALGELALYDVAGVVPAPFNGQLVALFALNGLFIGLAIGVVYRNSGSLVAAFASFAAILGLVGQQYILPSNWIPHLHFAPFLLLMVAGAALLTGRSLMHLPSFILAGGFLVHGHSSLVPVVLAFAAIVGAIWAYRARRAIFRALRAEMRTLLLAAGVLAILLLPMVLDAIINFPGEWGDYVGYARFGETRGHHTLAQSLPLLRSFWPVTPLMGAVFVGVFLSAVAFVAFTPRSQSRRLVASLLAVVAVVSLLFVGYAKYFADDLKGVGIFYFAAPATLLVAGAMSIALLANRGRILTGVAALLSLALAGVSTTRGGFVLQYRGATEIPRMVATVEHAPLRSDRPVWIEFRHELWVSVVGFVVEANRAGLSTCVQDPVTPVLFTDKYICAGAYRPDYLRVRFDFSNDPVIPGNVVWNDFGSRITLIE